MRTSESKGHEQLYDSSAAFEPEVRKRTRGTTCANFGFAALVRHSTIDFTPGSAAARRRLTRRALRECRRAPAHEVNDRRDHEQNDRDKEDNFRDLDREAGDAAKSEYCGNQRNNQKGQ